MEACTILASPSPPPRPLPILRRRRTIPTFSLPFCFLPPFFRFPAVMGSHSSSSCLNLITAKHERPLSPTASFLAAAWASSSSQRQVRFLCWLTSSLSRVALPVRISQTNPVVLGFGAASSVRPTCCVRCQDGCLSCSINNQRFQSRYMPHGRGTLTSSSKRVRRRRSAAGRLALAD
jgi:hypothetical protein